MKKMGSKKNRLVGLVVIIAAILLLSLALTALAGCEGLYRPDYGAAILWFRGTLDGNPWGGDIKYTLYERNANKTNTYAKVREGFVMEDFSKNENHALANFDEFTIRYISGGPPGAVFQGISCTGHYGFKSVDLNTFQVGYGTNIQATGMDQYDANLTFDFITTGTVNVDATLNGQPWSGQTDYTVSGANTTAGKTVGAIYKYMKPGDYKIIYKSGGPEGGILKSITPAKAGLTVGQSVNYTLNFVTNSLNIVATLDGRPWSGPCEFKVNPPRGSQTDQTGIIDSQAGQVQIISSTGESTSYNGTVVPAVFEHTPNGVYRLAYVSGGPSGRLESITPEPVTLMYGQTGTLSINFTTKGTINVKVYIDGQPWSGDVGFSLSTNVDSGVMIGSSQLLEVISRVPYSTVQLPGKYLVNFLKTLPNGAKLISYSPDNSQVPFLANNIANVINELVLMPGGEANCEIYYTTTGAITIAGTENSQPWSGPCEFTLTALDYAHAGGGRVTFAGHTLPADFTGMQKGRYEVTYLFGGPSGAGYSRTLPSSTLLVTVGENTGAVMEFVNGSITVTGVIYAANWDGACSYQVTGDTPGGTISFTGTEVPFTFTDLPLGQYSITYLSGGPDYCQYYDIWGSDTIKLTAAENTGKFRIRFISLPVVAPPAVGADLSITLVPDTISIAQSAGVVTFTITVTNSGPLTATGVEVTFLPNGASWLAGGAGVYNTVTGIWTAGDINSGASVTLTITALAGIITGPYTNTAEVTLSGTFDPDSTPNNHVGGEDDQATVIITVT